MRPIPAGGFFAVALLTGFLAVVWFAGQRGLADVMAQEPRHEMEGWRSGKLAGDKTRLDAILAALNEALVIDPRNPRLLEEAALFHVNRVAGRLTLEPDVREARLQSLSLFRQAVEQRPTSGQAWVSVALIKLQLGETDREFSQSLQEALRRSPWEPQVELLAIEVGLAGWQALPDSLHETLKQAIQAQAQWQLVKQKSALQALLKRYGRADLNYLLE
jgi:hypothetical protein